MFSFAILTILITSGIFGVHLLYTAHGALPANFGPKSAGIRVTQYTGTVAEANAFEAGDLDIQDWPMPFARAGPTGTWNTCGSTAPIAVNCEGTKPVSDAVCAADNAVAANTCVPAKVKLYRVFDIGMFEFDFNNFNYALCPTAPAGSCSSSTLTNNFNPMAIRDFRHAIAKMVDHAKWLADIAGSFGVLICDPAPSNLPWDLHSVTGTATQPTCLQDQGATGSPLAYNGVAGDPNGGALAVEPYDPVQAATLIKNLGFKTGCTVPANGVTPGAPALCAPSGLPFVLRVQGRIDDPIRFQFGLNLAAEMGQTTGCAWDLGGVCAFAAAAQVAFGTTTPLLLPVIFTPVTPATATIFDKPFDSVEIYTAGFGLSIDPTFLHDIWSSAFAPVACGGGWTSVSPSNYICYTSADTVLNNIEFAPTQVQGYAAGTTALKTFLSDLPMYPLYNLNHARPVSVYDQTPGGPGSLGNGWDALPGTFWKSLNNFRDRVGGSGFGPDSYDSFLNMQVGGCLNGVQYPCLSVDSSRSGTSPSTFIDYAFRFPILKANPVTSTFLWDFLLMGLAYETLVVRDTTTAFAGGIGVWSPHLALNSPAYSGTSTPGYPFDPTLSTSPDWSDYVNPDTGLLASYVRFHLPPTGQAPWTNGDSLTAEDVQFSIEYQMVVIGTSFASVFDVRCGGLKPGAASTSGPPFSTTHHCNGITLQDPNPDGTHRTIIVELNHQSAWIRNNIGAGYFLINHKAWGCGAGTGTGSFAVSYDTTTCFTSPDTQFPWPNSAFHITNGPWVLSSISTTGGTHLALANTPGAPNCFASTTATSPSACPGYWQEARLTTDDPDVNRDGKVNIQDIFGILKHNGDDRSNPASWTLTTDSFGANSPRADVNYDQKVNLVDLFTFLKYNGLTYPCQFGTNLAQDPVTGTLSCQPV